MWRRWPATDIQVEVSQRLPAQGVDAAGRFGLSRQLDALVWLAVVIAFSATCHGCAGLRNRLAVRSAECSQLCEKSRQARQQGLDEKANELLDAAVRQRPSDSETQLSLAEELWSSGRQIAAADVVARMVAERPDDAPAALRLARMEFEIGRIAAAESALRLAMLNDPENPEGLRLKAELAARHQNWDTAIATYQQLVQQLPDDLNAQLALAEVHIQRGQPDRAAPIYRRVLSHPMASLDQKSQAEWQLGISYAQADRWSDAARCLEHALASRPGKPDDWYRLAYAQAKIGQEEAAYASLSRALEIAPGHVAALELARTIKLGQGTDLSGIVPAGFSLRTAATTSPETQTIQ